MKVLQVNCVYKKGSTGKIVYDIHTELKYRVIASIVCYGRGKKINEENRKLKRKDLYQITIIISKITSKNTRLFRHIIPKL